MEATYVGIDVSKAELSVCVQPSGEAFVVKQDAASLRTLGDRLALLAPALVVLEASGGYERGAVLALTAAGVPFAVVEPGRVRHFAQAIGLRAKSDRLDAALIARFAATTRPPAQSAPDDDAALFAALVARRRQLTGMQLAEENRLAQAHHPQLAEAISSHIKDLEVSVAGIDGDLDRLIRKNEAWSRKEALLRSVPGVGPVTARSLLCFLPELGQGSRQGIAALAGLAPMTRESGKWQGHRSIAGGRAQARGALYMPALVASRHNPVLARFYDRLLAAAKPKKVALVAVMRRLLGILHAIVKSGVPWDDGRAQPAPSI